MILLSESREKLHWGGGREKKENDKTMSSEKSWRTPVLYVAANIPSNWIHVRNAIIHFFVKFQIQWNTDFMSCKGIIFLGAF